MSKFDPIKMQELVRVEESGGELVMTFQGGRTLRIRAEGPRLVSELS